MDLQSSLVLVDGFVIFARAEMSVSLKRDRETSLSLHASVDTALGLGWRSDGTEEDVPLPFAFLPRRI